MESFKSHILVVDDDEGIRSLLKQFLNENGYLVNTASNALEAKEKISIIKFDLLVLDIMMPGKSGLEFISENKNNLNVPIILLTAKGEASERVEGLETGADDYLLKPFELEELSARLRALLRRNAGISSQSDLKVADLILCRQTEVVTRRGIELNLTPTGKKILALLMKEAPNVVSRKRLEKEIWGDMPPDSDALRSHLYTLRKIVDKPFDHPLIHTVQSSGFRMSVNDDH